MGRVTSQGQDVFRYQIDARANILLRRPHGLSARYNPAVTPAGTVYFDQSSNACRPPVQIARLTTTAAHRHTTATN